MISGADGEPPVCEFALYLSWLPGQVKDADLVRIADEVAVEPRDEPCVYWRGTDPTVLVVAIGVDADNHALAARRGVIHVHDVLRRLDPGGRMVRASVMNEAGTSVFTGLDPDWLT